MTGEESTRNELSGPALVNTVVNTTLAVLVGLVDKMVETDGPCRKNSRSGYGNNCS